MKKHLFLIGMMGCGKSTMGKNLSALLACPLIDLDEDIAAFEGRSISDIFSEGGDALFRLKETAALRRALAQPSCIISTGGGIITREENIALMRENGLVIWLCRPLEDILKKIDANERPNLAGNAEERMRTLYAAREPLYTRAAHVRFDNRMAKEAAAKALASSQDILDIL